jgi:hypothetical protein
MLGKYYLASTSKGTKMAPYKVPGVGEVTLDQWNSLPKEVKNYAVASQNKDFAEVLKEADSGDTAAIKYIKEMMRNPEFREMALLKEKAGAITIPEYRERREISEKIDEFHKFRQNITSEEFLDTFDPSTRLIINKKNKTPQEKADAYMIINKRINEEAKRLWGNRVKFNPNGPEGAGWYLDGEFLTGEYRVE